VPDLHSAQQHWAAYLRNPTHAAPPPDVEPRRLQVYRDLVFNNIEGFLRNGFPVLHSLYARESWRELVRAFIRDHPCSSPYFLEISQEFLAFLMQHYQPLPADPPFLRELAHYEWVELALDVAEDSLPPPVSPPQPLLETSLQLSPLAWLLAYRFPVHRIGPDFQPQEPGEPVYLLVWRNRAQRVEFMVLNAATARLLELCRDQPGCRAGELIDALAGELQQPAASLAEAGARQLAEFVQRDILLVEP